MRYKIDGIPFEHKREEGKFIAFSPSYGLVGTYLTSEAAQAATSAGIRLDIPEHWVASGHLIKDAVVYRYNVELPRKWERVKA